MRSFDGYPGPKYGKVSHEDSHCHYHDFNYLVVMSLRSVPRRSRFSAKKYVLQQIPFAGTQQCALDEHIVPFT